MTITTIRALTVHQPWAACIAAGVKTIENRTWAPKTWRGTLLIHAGVAWDTTAKDSPAPVEETFIRHTPPGAGTQGAVVAVAMLKDCHPADGRCCAPWGQPQRWIWHWELAGIQALERPVPCRGRQRLWIPDAGLLAELGLTDAVLAEYTLTTAAKAER